MGHLVVARAAETAIELARECGVAWVGCRMSGHAGAAGVYAALPLKADMVGLYSAVANANHMPLAGGADPVLGTNPLAIENAASKEPPVVLDIATSIVSYGTIKNHRLQNKPLQNGWMIDPKTGEAALDPHKSAEALLLPMAGYKGAGLALTFGLLAGTLNGALFGRESSILKRRSIGTSASFAARNPCRDRACGCRGSSGRCAATTACATEYRSRPNFCHNLTNSLLNCRSSHCASAPRGQRWAIT